VGVRVPPSAFFTREIYFVMNIPGRILHDLPKFFKIEAKDLEDYMQKKEE
jgi:hypothetical protein